MFIECKIYHTTTAEWLNNVPSLMVTVKNYAIPILIQKSQSQCKILHPHCIILADKKTSRKNERNCYHYADRKWKSQKVARASPREWKTVQKWTEKNERFYLEKCQTTHAFKTRKTRKKCLCSFFSVHLLVFFHFSKWKKIKKNGKVSKKSHFFQFFLMLCAPFSKTFALHKMLMFKLLFLKIKIWKKHKKNFKNFFEE